MKKILLIVNSGLGDILTIIPVIRTLKKKYPNAQLDIYTNKDYVKEIFQYDPDIVNIVDAYSNIVYSAIICCANVAVYSSKDLILYKLRHPKTKILLGVFRAKYYINWLKKVFFITRNVNFNQNIRYNNLQLLYALGVRESEYIFDNQIANLGKFESSTITCSKPYIILNIGASSGLETPKRWPMTKWQELIRYIKNLDVALVGHKDDIKLAEGTPIDQANVINLVGKTTISELISLIKNAVCSISADSGFAHLANAIGVSPLILLWGPSPFNYNRPLNFKQDKTQYIISKVPCAPCFGADDLHTEREALAKCNYQNACMHSLEVKDVLTKLALLGIYSN